MLIRPGAIGDTIVSFPALEFCRTAFTEVWVSGSCVPLVRFANWVRSVQATKIDLLELGLETPATADLARFDSIISWYGSSRAQFRDAVSELPFTFHPALPGESGLPAVDFYMRQVGGPDGAIPVVLTEAGPKRNFCAIHPFSGSTTKNWPLDNFLELASALPLAAEFSAGPEEKLAGATRFASLGNMADWLAEAKIYVGNDSGISHLAAAVGTPVVAIFRKTDPKIWAPRGRAAVRILQGEPSVEEVLEVVREVLAT